MSASDPPSILYASAADCIRDTVFLDRIRHRLKTARVAARIDRGLDHEPAQPGLRHEIEQRIAASDALLCLYSREAREDRWIAYELACAARLERPALVLLYPTIEAPGAPVEPESVFDLEGFVDSGPALPPGTDEGRFFHRSAFVEGSLAHIEAFVRSVIERRRAATPDVTSDATNEPSAT